jgi:hypothetical protein
MVKHQIHNLSYLGSIPNGFILSNKYPNVQSLTIMDLFVYFGIVN